MILRVKGKEFITRSVVNCARCGGEHEKVRFFKFDSKSIDRYNFWGLCPETHDPILMKIAVAETEDKGEICLERGMEGKEVAIGEALAESLRKYHERQKRAKGGRK